MRSADIAYITDLHFTRLHKAKWFGGINFFDEQINKLQQFVSLCKSMQVKLILCGGDVFHNWDELDIEIANWLSEVLDCGIPFRTVVGNHDVLQSNAESYKKSSLSILSRLLYFDRYEIKSIPELDGYSFDFIHWYSPEKELLMDNQYKGSGDGIRICVAHAPIAHKSSEWAIGVDKLHVEDVDYVLLGDQHTGHEIINYNGCKIINPGSFGILNKDEINRCPKCVFIKDRQAVIKHFDFYETKENLVNKKISKSLNDYQAISEKKIDMEQIWTTIVAEKDYEPEVLECLKKKL